MNETVKIIAQQIRAIQLQAMIGVTQFTAHEDALSFKWKAKSNGNYCKITYDYNRDLYNMEIKKIGRAPNFTITVIDSSEGVYADQLMTIFESVTGLTTSL